MPELETLLGQFQELSINNPDSVFRICPGENPGEWVAEFTKFGRWWPYTGEGGSDGEKVMDAIKGVVDNFGLSSRELVELHGDGEI